MTELSRLPLRPPSERDQAAFPCFAGHPSLEELLVAQGTGPIIDPSILRGDFWPEDEAVEDFVAAVREWRGHSA